jgi:hypothetical protein
MIAAPILTTLVAGGGRRQGWRGGLLDAGRTVWRCNCEGPHRSPELAMSCATDTLNKRDSGYYRGREYLNEYLDIPKLDTEREDFVSRLRANIPESAEEAMNVLSATNSIMMAADTYEGIREQQSVAEVIKLLFWETQEVRQRAERVFLIGEWRISKMRLDDEVHRKGQGPKYSWRLKQLAGMRLEGLESFIYQLHRVGKEATLTSITKLLRAEQTGWRRLNSLTSPRIEPDVGMDLRIGDAREVLSDIEDDSIPLILTDPPYEEAAEPLWRWLAEFAQRVLMPGGSLICYFGGIHVNRLYRIFDDSGLIHWWQAAMLHGDAQRLGGRFVIAQHKPVLWYVKGHRRGRTLVPDVLRDSMPDKVSHGWAQGDGGIRVWIHHLTEPGETIVDPFAGTATWGLIACDESRRWVGSDVAMGGTTTVVADEIPISSEEDGE